LQVLQSPGVPCQYLYVWCCNWISYRHRGVNDVRGLKVMGKGRIVLKRERRECSYLSILNTEDKLFLCSVIRWWFVKLRTWLGDVVSCSFYSRFVLFVLVNTRWTYDLFVLHKVYSGLISLEWISHLCTDVCKLFW